MAVSALWRFDRLLAQLSDWRQRTFATSSIRITMYSVEDADLLREVIATHWNEIREWTSELLTEKIRAIQGAAVEEADNRTQSQLDSVVESRERANAVRNWTP